MNNHKINKFLQIFLINQFKNIQNKKNNNNQFPNEIKDFWKIIRWFGGKKIFSLFKGNSAKNSNEGSNKIASSNSTQKKYKKTIKMWIYIHNQN